jgi:predicted DNA-binding transcriptional regulator AlpA
MKRGTAAAHCMELLMSERRLIVGWRALEERVGRSRVQLWRDIRNGRFPPPIELGPNSVGWWADEVDENLNSRARRTYGAPQPAVRAVRALLSGIKP